MVDCGFLDGRRYLIHDRDGKYCPAFLGMIEDAGVKPLKLPAHSPNLNPVAEELTSASCVGQGHMSWKHARVRA
jgi:hypothetical protein